MITCILGKFKTSPGFLFFFFIFIFDSSSIIQYLIQEPYCGCTIGSADYTFWQHLKLYKPVQAHTWVIALSGGEYDCGNVEPEKKTGPLVLSLNLYDIMTLGL